MVQIKVLQTACTIGLLALAGCSTSTMHTSNQSADIRSDVTLQSHHWQLKQAYTEQGQIDNQWQMPASAESSFTSQAIGLRFLEDNLLSIDRLCNSMRSSYRIKGETITISPIASTLMACQSQALERLEREVAEQLPKATKWTITNNPITPILELTFDGGTRWQLQGTATKETLYGQSEQIFLEIAAQKVPCNESSASSAQCLQVRPVHYNEQGIQTGVGSWGAYNGSIEGYTHREGERNVLRVKRYTRDQTKQDYLDVLDLLVSSEIAP